MFPGCNLAEKFGVGYTKASDFVRLGLGRVIRDELAKDIDESSNMITLVMDKTAIKHVIKQMDVLVRYWSEKDSAVVTRYLDSQVFGHAKAVDLCVKVCDAIQLVDTKLLLKQSMDGLNVNKSLWGNVYERLISLCFPGLTPLVVCCLHIMLKAFHYGYVQYGSEVESLDVAPHGWFKIAPCKREDI